MVNIISEASTHKQQAMGTSVEIEIGNPPETTLSSENDTDANDTVTADPNALNFVAFENVVTIVWYS